MPDSYIYLRHLARFSGLLNEVAMGALPFTTALGLSRFYYEQDVANFHPQQWHESLYDAGLGVVEANDWITFSLIYALPYEIIINTYTTLEGLHDYIICPANWTVA